MVNLKNILILNAGTRNTLIQNFKRTAEGQLDIIATDSFNLAPALYEADRHYVTKRWDAKGYWDDIEDICKKNNVGLIVSLIDPELSLLAKERERFEKLGIVINSSTTQIISDCFDKYMTLDFLKKNGFPWIKSYITLSDTIDALRSGELAFPIFAKPRDGSGSAGIEKINDIEHLKLFFEKYESPLIQEYMSSQEIGLDVYIDLITGEPISIFAKKKIKMRAGETDKSVSFKDQKLFDTVIDFAKKFGLKGANDIDVFERDGNYYISEVNPRFGGGYVHAYAAGVDFPKLLINNMNGISNTPNIGDYKENNYMMKYFAIKVMDGSEIDE